MKDLTLRNSDIINENWLHAGKFFTQRFEKDTIVLHHTASGPSVDGDIAWWNSDPRRIATAFIIDKHGIIHRTFNENCWAYHIGGVPANVEQRSIGIELTNWGPLKYVGGKYVNWLGKAVNLSESEIVKLQWRNHRCWEDYSDSQISSLKILIEELCKIHNINKPQQVTDSWFNATGNPSLKTGGIFPHSAYRTDKTDVYPNRKLIYMLNSL